MPNWDESWFLYDSAVDFSSVLINSEREVIDAQNFCTVAVLVGFVLYVVRRSLCLWVYALIVSGTIHIAKVMTTAIQTRVMFLFIAMFFVFKNYNNKHIFHQLYIAIQLQKELYSITSFSSNPNRRYLYIFIHPTIKLKWFLLLEIF